MTTATQAIADQVRALPDIEKLALVDQLLAELDRPDPELDRIWAEEARRRWLAYKDGRAPSVSYAEAMAKFRHLHREPRYWVSRMGK